MAHTRGRRPRDSLCRSLLHSLVSLACGAAAADRQRFTMLVDIAGQEIEGMPLAWSQQRVFLLGRDGRLWEFAPAQATRFRKTSASFSSYSAAEMQAAMEREFAGRLEITGTGHYLVAHPPGKGNFWASRFEDLYRSARTTSTAASCAYASPSFRWWPWSGRAARISCATRPAKAAAYGKACWATTRR